MTSSLGPRRVRVICVTYNPGPELADFAASLRTATTADVELVLADNGPVADVVDQIASTFGARVLRTGVNLGYGGGANAGATDARQPWLVVANTDIVWEAGALDALIDAAESDPKVAAVGPALLNPDGTVYPSARELPSLTQGVGHALFVRVWPGNPWTRDYHRRQEEAGSQRFAGWLSGACLVLRREAFEQVGGFDDAFFMFFEDVDLGERLAQAGWRNLYVPSVHVTHVGGTSWRERPASMITAHHRSAATYLRRRYHHWYEWPVRTALAVGLRWREVAQLRAARRSSPA